LLLHLGQLLGDQISVRSDCLVQGLLFLEFGLGLDVLFLELCDEVIAELDLISRVEVLGLCGGGLEGVGITLFLQGDDGLVQFLNLLLLPKQLVLLLLHLLLPVEDFLQ
jgi:hypothetical protein